MKDIVEHVSRETNGDFWNAFDAFCAAKGFSQQQILAEKSQSTSVKAMRVRSIQSIRATLEYARDKARTAAIEITNEPKNIPPDVWTFLKGEMQEDFRDLMTSYLDALLQEIGGRG